MHPARLDLPVVPGATNRKPLWLLQPEFVYKPIEKLEQSAPLRMRVPGHDLPADWPCWFEGVSGWSELNSDKLRQAPRIARVIDEDTVELNELNGRGTRASGGDLVYQLPVDLAGCTGRLLMTSGATTLELTTANGGLVIEGPGQVLIVITPAQSEALLNWRGGTYTFDLVMSNGDVMRWAEGPVVVSRAGGACNGC